MAIFFKKISIPPKHLLISRTDRIGDFVLTLPVFQAIKNYSDVKISVLCQSSVASLLNNNPYVDHIIKINGEDYFKNIIPQIQDLSPDALLVMVNDLVIRQLIPALHYIPIRIGPLSKIQMLRYYTHPVLQKRSYSKKNEAQYNLELLKIFQWKIDDVIKPQLYLTEVEKQFFFHRIKDTISIEELRKAVILHPGMSGSALNLPMFKYQEIIERLLQQNLTVILTGFGANEKKDHDLLIQSTSVLTGKILSLANQCSLRDLAILISQAKLFIGPSTGPTHLANAVNTPLISFYPSLQVQSATRWEPYLAKSKIFSPSIKCPKKLKCQQNYCPYYNCLEQISTDSIIESALNFLKF